MAPSSKESSTKPTKRQRKTHRKSRLGCQNCKLRSVKCDEAKPACRRCCTSGFNCNYSTAAATAFLEPALQIAHAGAFQVDLRRRESPRMNITIPPPNPHIYIPVATPVQNGGGQYELTLTDYSALHRFQKNTVRSLGSAALRETYSCGIKMLGNLHPYLLHAYLTLSYIHEQDLCIINQVVPSNKTRVALAFHWYHATVLHKQTLMESNQSSSERDAIWAAASLLYTAAFAFMSTHDAAAHWPNKPTENIDSQWLRLSIGKKAVWELTNPLRPDSAFKLIGTDFGMRNAPIIDKPIPPGTYSLDFMSLFELDEDSNPENNIYFSPASILAQVLTEKCDEWNILRFLAFSKDLQEPFSNLLFHDKEPRALLLLSWWWAKVCTYDGWWLARRAIVEGRAICLYLASHHPENERLQELVKYPQSVFDLCECSVQEAMTRSTYISDPSLATLGQGGV